MGWGLVLPAFSYRSTSLLGFRAMCPVVGEPTMKLIVLKDCLETLERIRAEKRGTLEAGLAAELDEVLATLHRLHEEATESGEDIAIGPARYKVVDLVLRMVQATTNLAELIDQIMHGQ